MGARPWNNHARMRTGRKAQQALFLESLWREMDKLSTASSAKDIYRTAASYSAEGYGPGEIIELLVADGHDPSMAKSCVAKLSSDDAEDDGEGSEWGFEAEDQTRGDVVGNHDVRCASISAPNEKTAWERAQAFLDENCSDTYAVTRVYPL